MGTRTEGKVMLVGWVALLGAVVVSLGLAELLAAVVNQRIARLVAAAGASDPDASPLTGSCLDRR
jgi:hypothetical protein